MARSTPRKSKKLPLKVERITNKAIAMNIKSPPEAKLPEKLPPPSIQHQFTMSIGSEREKPLAITDLIDYLFYFNATYSLIYKTLNGQSKESNELNEKIDGILSLIPAYESSEDWYDVHETWESEVEFCKKMIFQNLARDWPSYKDHDFIRLSQNLFDRREWDKINRYCQFNSHLADWAV